VPALVQSTAVTRRNSAHGVRHIVWDWNGTLLDDIHAVVAAVNTVCTEFGRDHVDVAQWRAMFGRPLVHCYERLLERSLSEQDWARIDELYHNAYRELLHTCRLAQGVPDVLRTWGQQGGTQSLLSMWFHDELVPLVTELGLHALFARIDGLRSRVGGGSKAQHLETHLNALALDASDVVLVGDVEDDARAAEQIGAQCVLLTTGAMSREVLERTGYPVVDSIPAAIEAISGPRAA
jgi:phosphoglycolate phosphatase-like HAD superfamily hydrolase